MLTPRTRGNSDPATALNARGIARHDKHFNSSVWGLANNDVDASLRLPVSSMYRSEA